MANTSSQLTAACIAGSVRRIRSQLATGLQVEDGLGADVLSRLLCRPLEQCILLVTCLPRVFFADGGRDFVQVALSCIGYAVVKNNDGGFLFPPNVREFVRPGQLALLTNPLLFHILEAIEGFDDAIGQGS